MPQGGVAAAGAQAQHARKATAALEAAMQAKAAALAAQLARADAGIADIGGGQAEMQRAVQQVVGHRMHV